MLRPRRKVKKGYLLPADAKTLGTVAAESNVAGSSRRGGGRDLGEALDAGLSSDLCAVMPPRDAVHHPGGGTPARIPGYWLAGGDGGVFAFNAPFFGSGFTASILNSCGFSPQAPSTLNAALGCSGIASDPDGAGYWLLNVYRSATPFGGAILNPASCTSTNGAAGTWTGVAVSENGQGVWLVSANGGVMGCGSAPPPLGGTTNLRLAAPIVGIAPTPDRGGYWLVGADGGVFGFGDARFYGSTGGRPLNGAIVGIAATPDGKGYWLVAADGGVFAFGDAAYEGSMAGTVLNAPIVGMAVNAGGRGYWLAAADGGVFSLGGAPYEGSMGGTVLNGPIVGIATAPGA